MPAIALWLLLQQDLDDAVRRYLAAPTKELADEIAKRPLVEIERAIRTCAHFDRLDAGMSTYEAPNGFDAAQKVKCVAWIPTHDHAKRHPLLVVLHGQGGTADDFIRAWLTDAKREEGLFVVAPDAGRGGWGRSRVGYGNVLGPIRDALARFPIDPDRVHVSGASMGAHGAFQFACHHPDILATMSARIGGPELTRRRDDPKKVTAHFLENLRNVPVYWIVGRDDSQSPIDWMRAGKERMEELKLDLTWRELEGGHEFFPEETPKVIAWLRDRKRDPVPKVVHHVTTERLFARSYWLEITGFAKEAQELIDQVHAGPAGDKIETRRAFANPVEARAELDREANAIRITTRHVDEITLHLSDAMLDLDREVTVVVNGSTRAKKKVERSVKTLLDSASRDRSMLFSAQLVAKTR